MRMRARPRPAASAGLAPGPVVRLVAGLAVCLTVCLAAGLTAAPAVGATIAATGPAASAPDPATAGPDSAGPGAAATAAAPDSAARAAPLTAYYFHGTIRCRTCLAIEAMAEQALRTGFRRELAAGELDWRPVNLDEAGNGHFRDDFGLEGSSLVLVRRDDGDGPRWKVLDEVWRLVDDRPAFLAYVRRETAAWLDAGAPAP